ncbi:MAG: N-acetyltransferase [Eubacteriales bacterium]|nr:N-acetyltransferase [Eubacteriales bacterium]
MNNSNQSLERFELRNIKAEEVEEATRIEAICFPPEEACPFSIMKERITVAADCFLVAIDKNENKMAGFINGLCTDDWHLKDEIFTNTSLHDPTGSNVMICGVDVLPEYRKQGLAREMMKEFLRRQKTMGRKQAVLTCVPTKVSMYEKFGYTDLGESDSTWGGEKWHEMSVSLEKKE